MDFTKFVAMLESQALFFARSDRLGDKFEGSYPLGNKLLRQHTYESHEAAIGADPSELIKTHRSALAKWQRSWTFINCWHMNHAESAAMWRLYARSNEAIAIQSKFFRLINVLDNDTYVGQVEYIDFEQGYIPEGNVLHPFLHKRQSFSHESEIRALCCKWPVNEAGIDINAEPTAFGLEKHVNLHELIEQVYVAPTADSWFRDLVRKVCLKYGLNKPIRQSSLDADPFY